MANLASKVQQGHRVPKGQQDQQAPPVLMVVPVPQALKGQQAPPVPQGLQVSGGLVVIKGHKAFLAKLVLRERLVAKAQQGQRDLLGSVKEGLVAIKGRKASRVNREQSVPQGQPGLPVPKGQRASQGHKDPKGQQAFRELKVPPECQASKVRLVRGALKETSALKGRKDQLVPPGLPVPVALSDRQDLPGFRGQQAKTPPILALKVSKIPIAPMGWPLRSK